MRKTLLAIFSIILVLSSVAAGAASRDSKAEGLDDLSKRKGLFKKTLIHPDADFSRYSNLLKEPVLVQFRVQSSNEAEAGTGNLLNTQSKGSSAPDAEDRATFSRIVSDALSQELSSYEGLALVEETGPGTLILRASVLDILSKIPVRSEGETELRGKLIAQGTIVFDLIDAETGVILARLSERRKIFRENAKGSADFTMLWADVQEWARRAAADLLVELEETRKSSSAAG